MGLRSFFHKIIIGFERKKGTSLPRPSEAKKYGDNGEDKFIIDVLSRLPYCNIKKNIIIKTPTGNAEIDCLMLYKNKLFAIEIKRWKGQLIERDEHFIKYKSDRYTNDIYSNVLKSPFKQLGRAIYLLKKQIPDNAWVNPIVFFEESTVIDIESNNVWFNDVDKLISYITKEGKASQESSAKSFFDKCVAADYLFDISQGKYLRCAISDDSLNFITHLGKIKKRDIASINIEHHWAYDELKIKMRNKHTCTITVENGSVAVLENGSVSRYSLSKIDRIVLSN